MNDATIETAAELSGAHTQEAGNATAGAGSTADFSQVIPPGLARTLRLAKLAGVHGLILLVAFCLFAAADSWSVITGLGLAAALALATGALAGITAATLIHEWFHLLGARYSRGEYDIPDKLGLFVYDWKFSSNTVQQFNTMSIAGSVGGALSIIFLWMSVPADTLGRAALLGGAVAGFVFGSIIEWPVLQRTQISGEPLAELSKINQQVLTRAFLGAMAAGVIVTFFALD